MHVSFYNPISNPFRPPFLHIPDTEVVCRPFQLFEIQFLIEFLSLFSSITQSCPTLCDPMDCRLPGLPVHHQLLELTQTHVYRVGDAIQASHSLLSPSPPAFDLSQHQGLFK